MQRRELLKGLTTLSIVEAIDKTALKSVLSSDDSMKKNKSVTSIYESIGVRPLINGRGTVTIVGGSRIPIEVQNAMDMAVREYVQIDELMDAVGMRLAELTGTEFGCITAGASAAITAATAGCVTGGDPDKIWLIPNITGMKDEVIITSYSRSAYDAGIKAVGVRLIQVSDIQSLRSAIGPRTAMIYLLAGRSSEQGPLSLKNISEISKPLGIPILVDAAAEGLENPNPHISQGADLVAYSGGKYLRGPQCAGLLLGRKDLIMASRMNTGPHHGFGRGFKVGREEIIGMLTAVEVWFKTDHINQNKQWTLWLEHIYKRLEPIPGLKMNITQPHGRSNPSPSLVVEWDMSKIPLLGYEVEQLLWDGYPRVAVSGAGSFLPFPPNMLPNISINSSQLESGEEKIIADKVYDVLSNPRKQTNTIREPAFNLTGQWDLEMKFYASTVNQRMIIEQKGNNLIGTHIACIGMRDLEGFLDGDKIMVRSSYTNDGARINIEFTGTVKDDAIEGEANLCEYGTALWKAKRHKYFGGSSL